MIVKVRQSESKSLMLKSWDILSAKSPWVVIGHSAMLEWLVHDKADVVCGKWRVVYLLIFLKFGTLHACARSRARFLRCV